MNNFILFTCTTKMYYIYKTTIYSIEYKRGNSLEILCDVACGFLEAYYYLAFTFFVVDKNTVICYCYFFLRIVSFCY